MYGTVARLQLKPGMEAKLATLVEEYETLSVIGHVGTYVFQMDNNPNEYQMIALFDNEESYKRNATSSDQDTRYRKLRDLLIADPEWHDGAVIYSHMREQVR